jgi:flagellar biosynthesis anti-sigma factor FlgM
MKIDEINQNINLISHSHDSAVNRKGEGPGEKVQGQSMGSVPSTEVEFSEKSVEFSRAAKIIETEPEERTALVNKIKAKIENGTYDIDGDKIAGKMLKDALSGFMEP